MYNLALIGYGYWGPKLARNIQNSNHFKINYIIDKYNKNLKSAKKDFPLSKLLKYAKNDKERYFDLFNNKKITKKIIEKTFF